MKLIYVTPADESTAVPCIQRGDEVVDLRGAAVTDGPHSPMANAIERMADSGRTPFQHVDGPRFDRHAIDIRPPIPPEGRVICLGGVYTGHLRERDDPLNRVPSQWIAPEPAVVGHRSTIELRQRVRVDTKPAVELGAVVGKAGRHIDEADSYDHLAGYTVCNDVTARTDWPGPMGYKLMDTFWPVGPGITPAESIPNPTNLEMSIDIDGERVCTGSSAGMRFTISFLVSYLSEIFELRPGDVISMGDPGDVGGTLEPGSTVTNTIEGVGQLVNTVGRR